VAEQNGNEGAGTRPPRSTATKVLRIARWVAIGIAAAAVVILVFGVVFGLLVQWLWNTVVTDVFGVQQITYWQALGLAVLARLLVGVFETNARFPGRDCRSRGSAEALAQPAPPPPCQADYERYWQEEGRAAFAAYIQRQRQAGQRPEPE
jgi:hypothetical protein